MLASLRFSRLGLMLFVMLVVSIGLLVAACDSPPAGPANVGSPTDTVVAATTRVAPYPGFTVLPNGGTPWPSVTPGSVEDHMNKGNDAFQRDQFDEAIAEYTQAINLQPDLAAAYSDRSSAYIEKQDYDHALADAEQTIKLNPDLVWGYVNRGTVYRVRGDLDKAMADYQQAVKLKPDYAKGYFRIAEICEKRGQKDLALQNYQKAFNLTNDMALQNSIRDRLAALEGTPPALTPSP